MNQDIILKLLKSPVLEDVIIGINYLSNLEYSAVRTFLEDNSDNKVYIGTEYIAYGRIVYITTFGQIYFVLKDHIILCFTGDHIYILGESYRHIAGLTPSGWKNVTI